MAGEPTGRRAEDSHSRWFGLLEERLPFGVAPAVMLVLLLVSAPFVLGRRQAPGKVLKVWTFAQAHYDEYVNRVPLFEQAHPGVTIDLQLLPGNVMFDKLMSAFLADVGAPDLAEVEISAIGRFFLGRKSDCGWVDLKPRLVEEGYYDQMVQARFVPWSNRGSIYGVPHDIHPVVLLYRQDLLSEAGVDLPAEVETWDDFVQVFGDRRLTDTNGDGTVDRYAIMLIRDGVGHLRALLLQRGGDLFDAGGEVLMDGELCLDTLMFMRRLFYDYDFVFQQPAFGPDLYGPMKEDRLYTVLAADWFIGLIRKFAPELAGKWRAMPLPAWEPGGRRTSTWGGTMMGMTQQCEDKDLAWELLKFLYFDKDVVANRFATTRILPPYIPSWDAPCFRQPDDYVGGRPLGELLVELAPSVPGVQQNQYTAEALEEMNKAVYDVLNNDDYDRERAAQRLRKAANKIRERIEHDRFRTE